MQDRITHRQWAVLLGVAIGRAAFGYQMQTVASMAPFLVERLGIGYAVLGSLIGAYLLPGAFTALPAGVAGRRLGETRMLAAGLVLMALGSCIPTLAPSATALAVGRVVAGTGAVALSVMQGKVLADLFRGSGFIVAMGVAVGGFPVGVGLCQVLSPLLVAGLGWRSAYLAGAGLAAVAAVLVLAGLRGAPAGAAVRGFGWPSRRECGLVLVAGLVWTTYNAGYFGFLSYVPALLQSRGVAAGQIGWAISTAAWLNIPAILLGGLLTARIGLIAVFMIGANAMAGGILGIALSQDWLVWCVLFGSLGALHPGVIVAAGTLSARPENRAVGMGLFYTVYYIGGTMFPALCGGAADRFGTPVAALLTAGAIALLSPPLFLLHQRMLRSPVRPCMPAPVT